MEVEVEGVVAKVQHELAGANDVLGARKAVLGVGGSVLVCKPAREAAKFTA